MKGAYHRKIAFAWLLVIVLGFGIVGIFLTATYIALHTQKVTEEVLVATSVVSNDQKEYDEARRTTQQLVKVLEPIAHPVKYTALVDRIVTSITPGISLTNFVFESTKKPGVIQVTIVGVANTRAQLQRFEQSLRKEPLFQGVEIPISQLAQRQSVKFSVVITSQL